MAADQQKLSGPAPIRQQLAATRLRRQSFCHYQKQSRFRNLRIERHHLAALHPKAKRCGGAEDPGAAHNLIVPPIVNFGL